MLYTHREIRRHPIIALLFLLLCTTYASAQLTNNLLVDGAALSLGNAVTADPPGIYAIHYNPAGLTRLKGRHVTVGSMFMYAPAKTSWSAPEDYNIFSPNDRENNPIVNGFYDDHTEQQGVLYVPGHGGKVEPKVINMPMDIVPTWGFSINSPGSKFTFGSAVIFQMAGGADVEKDDPLKFNAQRSVMQRVTFASPTIAYEINDRLSVGFTVGFNHHGFYLRKPSMEPNVLSGVQELVQDALCGPPDDRRGFALAFIYNPCGGNVGPFDEIGVMTLDLEDKLSTHWNIGVLWKATDWMTVGVNYQSESKVELQGTFDFQYHEDFYEYYRQYRQSIVGALEADKFQAPTGLHRERANATMDMIFPQKFDIGVSLTPHPRWKINIDAHWVDWAVWDVLRMQLDRENEGLAASMILRYDIIGRDYADTEMYMKSTWSVGVGVEYTLTDRLKLRFGVENRPDSVPDAYSEANMGLAETVMYGAGAEYKWDADSVMELFVSYLESERDLPANTSMNANTDSLLNVGTNPYAGLDIKSEMSMLTWGVKYTRQW